MPTRIEVLKGFLSYREGESVSNRLPRDMYLTRIDIVAKFTITTNANNAPVYNQDDVLRLFKAVRLVAGGRPFIDAPGRWLYFKAYYEYPRPPRKDAPPTATGVTADVYVVIPIHFGVNPIDKFDRTAVIPAAELESLDLEVVWGSISDLGTNIDALSGTVDVVLYGVTKDDRPEAIVTPKWFLGKTAIPGAASGLGFSYNIQHDLALHKALVITADNADVDAGNRDNTVVSELQVFNEPENVEVITNTWIAWQEADAMQYNKTPVDGIVVLDALDVVEDVIWYTGDREGTYKLKASTTKAGGLALLYVAYLPFE